MSGILPAVNGTAEAAATAAATVLGKRALHVVHVDVTEVSQVFAVLGWFIICYGLVSYVVKERLYLSEPLIALTVGIVTGPYVLNWIDPNGWASTGEENNYIIYQFSRLVVGVQVLFCGIALPARYLRHNAGSLAILLIFVMTCAWFIVALLIWALIPGLNFLESLCLSAAITPTDPVLANSITKGRFAEKHVPTPIRNLIVAESGFNDGLGVPFLFLSLYLMHRRPGGLDEGLTVGQEIGRWIYGIAIYQVLLSCLYGAVVGYVARKSLKWAEQRMYIDKDNFLAYGLGLALFTIGTTGMFGSDDLLAAFVAGNSFTWDDWFRWRTEDDSVQDILDMLLNAAVFIYLGALIDWKAYWISDNVLQLNAWRVVLLAIGILFLRRPPAVFLASRFIPCVTNLRETLFVGWFGPIGISALFYVAVALRPPEEGGIPLGSERLREVYQPVVLFIIFGSMIGHGITVPMSKLGPHIVSRTTTLSRTRTITFLSASRPGSRPGSQPATRVNTMAVQTTPQQEIEVHQAEKEKRETMADKELWNPLLSVYDGLLHVALFWRKDSFWRKEPLVTSPEGVRGMTISAPRDVHAQRKILEEEQQHQHQQVDDSAKPAGAKGEPSSTSGDSEGDSDDAPKRNVAFVVAPTPNVAPAKPSRQQHPARPLSPSSASVSSTASAEAVEPVHTSTLEDENVDASRPFRPPPPAMALPLANSGGSRPSTPTIGQPAAAHLR